MRWGLTVAIVCVLTLLGVAVIWSFRLQRDAERAQQQRQQGIAERAVAVGQSGVAHAGGNTTPTPAANQTDLIERFESAPEGERVSALWELCQSPAITTPRKVAVLSQALQNQPQSVRSFAVSMLGSLGPEAAGAVPTLAAALNDPMLAVDACAALGKLGSAARPALPTLEELMNSGSPEVQRAALAAVAAIRAE